MHMHQMQARQGNFELEVVVKQNVRNWCHRLTHTETCTSEYIQLNMLSSLKDLISWYYIHNKDACNQARMKQVCTHSHSFTHTHTHTHGSKAACTHTTDQERTSMQSLAAALYRIDLAFSRTIFSTIGPVRHTVFEHVCDSCFRVCYFCLCAYVCHTIF